MKPEIIKISKIAVEHTGRNNIGCNTYRYKWCAWVKDDRKSTYGSYMRINGKDVPVKKGFIGTKRELINNRETS